MKLIPDDPIVACALRTGYAPWNCGLPLPVAEEGRGQFPQRSKNARNSVSPMHFSGTARRDCGPCRGRPPGRPVSVVVQRAVERPRAACCTRSPRRGGAGPYDENGSFPTTPHSREVRHGLD